MPDTAPHILLVDVLLAWTGTCARRSNPSRRQPALAGGGRGGQLPQLLDRRAGAPPGECGGFQAVGLPAHGGGAWPRCARAASLPRPPRGSAGDEGPSGGRGGFHRVPQPSHMSCARGWPGWWIGSRRASSRRPSANPGALPPHHARHRSDAIYEWNMVTNALNWSVHVQTLFRRPTGGGLDDTAGDLNLHPEDRMLGDGEPVACDQGGRHELAGGDRFVARMVRTRTWWIGLPPARCERRAPSHGGGDCRTSPCASGPRSTCASCPRRVRVWVRTWS